MSLDKLAAELARPGVLLVSTDVFDTILLRDASTETRRLETASRRAAAVLGVDPRTVTQLRWWAHDDAYRAVRVADPAGEARLLDMWLVVARALDLAPGAAEVMRDCEVTTDAEHLRPHRDLLDVLAAAARRGMRVVAVTDTWYSAADVEHLLRLVVPGPIPVDHVYSSADTGATKHHGGQYDLVARAEGVAPASILHVGDHAEVDGARARDAGWRSVHLPRRPRRGPGALLTRARAVPSRRARRR